MSHLPLPFYLTGDFIAHLPLSANDCKLIWLTMLNTLKRIFKSLFNFWTSPYRKGEWQYIFTSNLGLFVRGIIFPLFIPNAFDKLTNYFVSQWNLPSWLFVVITMVISIILDRAVTVIVRKISYLSVGNIYKQYSNPAIGSFAYTIFYVLYTALPFLILYFFNWICVTLCALGYLWAVEVLYAICQGRAALPENYKFRLAIHCVICLITTGILLYLVISYPNPFWVTSQTLIGFCL